MIGGRCNCGDTFSQAVLITRKLPFFTNLQLECRESAGYGSDLSKVTTICSVFGACGLVLHNRVIYFFPDFVGSACSIRQNIRKVGAYSGGDHLFPFRTEKLSPPALMVLRLMPRESKSAPTQNKFRGSSDYRMGPFFVAATGPSPMGAFAFPNLFARSFPGR